MNGEPFHELGPGVMGWAEDVAGELWISFILATKPGTGQGRSYLDSLPRDRTIIFPNVINAKLAGMLRRRGFQEEVRWIEEIEEAVDLFVRYGREAP